MMVAPLDRDRAHAGGARRLDVAQVVAEVAAGRGREAELLGGEQERGGMRLEVRRRIAAHYAGGRQLERGDEAVGKAHRLVCDDAPGDAAAAELVQELPHAGEKPRLDAGVLGVVLE